MDLPCERQNIYFLIGAGLDVQYSMKILNFGEMRVILDAAPTGKAAKGAQVNSPRTAKMPKCMRDTWEQDV